MKAVILTISLFMPISFHCVASAQLTKVTVGNNAISGNGLPVWMAIEAGIFRKNGLEVQPYRLLQRNKYTAMALVARETPISLVFWSAHRKRRPQGSRCGDDCRGKHTYRSTGS